jgi:dynein heavy chain 1
MLQPNDGSTNVIQAASMRWVVNSEAASRDVTTYQMPVYLFGDRNDLLFSVPHQCHASDRDILIQTGVALLAGE